MPNTLAHIGINGLITRGFIKDADLKWIYLGVVIPDLPWILQRILMTTIPAIDLYDLRLYCVAQASLFISLILCIAFSSLSDKPARCFSILSIGSVLHYVLDMMQIKWANGVNVFAPLDWNLISIGLFWPESTVIYVLTAGGLCYWLWYARLAFSTPWNIHFLPLKRIGFALFMSAFYLLLPAVFIDGPANANAHFVTTLRNSPKYNDYIEIDRGTLTKDGQALVIRPFTGDEFTVTGIKSNGEKLVSVQGRFSSDKTLLVSKYHMHTKFRDYASYLGLALVLLFWCVNGMRFALREVGISD